MREVLTGVYNNVGNKVKIVSLAFDRGFIDCPFITTTPVSLIHDG